MYPTVVLLFSFIQALGMMALTAFNTGQGNIGPDETQYVDGEIRREGDPTAAGGAYSAGVSYVFDYIWEG
jgi:hypothetical protein